MHRWMTSASPRISLLAVTVLVLLLTPGLRASSHSNSVNDASTLEGLPSSQASEPTVVSISEGNAAPDEQVVLSVSLSASDAVPVGAINIRLGFPKALLTFVEIELSGLSLAVEAKAHAEVRKGPNDADSILDATISIVSEAGSQRSLPVGRVAQLIFQVDKSAKPSTWIPLTHEVTASTTDDPPQLITPVNTYKTRIGVSLAPVTACFFYMH